MPTIVMSGSESAGTVREADHCDAAEIVRMLGDLQRFLASIDPLGRVRCGDGFGEYAYSELIVAVVEQAGKMFVVDTGSSRLAGFAAGFVCRPQTAADLLDVVKNRQGYLAKLYVDPDERTGGWGRLLVAEVETHLVTAGCDNMWVDVNAFNPAVDFYARMGFDPREIGLIKALPTNLSYPTLTL